MSYKRTSACKPEEYSKQDDAVVSQANPVSTTLYTVLDTTEDVRVISIWAKITWAVTQPTPLEVVVTRNGKTTIFTIANPVSNTNYFATINAQTADSTQLLETSDRCPQRPFLLSDSSVKIEIRITWAVTQPTPLECRVKYEKKTR